LKNINRCHCDYNYLAVGADIDKEKMGSREGHNHYVNDPKGAVITMETVWEQAEKYDEKDAGGHLYGAVIASLRSATELRMKVGF
jgi:hypothetical protein